MYKKYIPSFVWLSESIPPDLPPSHDSTQTCLSSQSLNSPGVTGLWTYPSRAGIKVPGITASASPLRASLAGHRLRRAPPNRCQW
jgi:hypothetical protein